MEIFVLKMKLKNKQDVLNESLKLYYEEELKEII